MAFILPASQDLSSHVTFDLYRFFHFLPLLCAFRKVFYDPGESMIKRTPKVKEFGREAGHKMSIQKSIAFICKNNDQVEDIMAEKTPFTRNKED